jgi:hypothetical protein
VQIDNPPLQNGQLLLRCGHGSVIVFAAGDW